MPSLTARLVSLTLFAALAAGAGEALAQRGLVDGARDALQARPPESAAERASDRRHDRRRDSDSLSNSVRRIERRTGGQVLSAERVPYDGREVNRVKVVDASGRVRVYMDEDRGAGARSRTRDDDD